MKNKKIFLSAYYFRRPAPKAQSQQKKFGEDPNNFVWDEKVEISTRIRNRDISMAGVILDITDGKVVKCTMGENREYSHLYEYYKKAYPQYFQHFEKQAPVEVTADTPQAEPLPETKVEGIN